MLCYKPSKVQLYFVILVNWRIRAEATANVRAMVIHNPSTFVGLSVQPSDYDNDKEELVQTEG